MSSFNQTCAIDHFSRLKASFPVPHTNYSFFDFSQCHLKNGKILTFCKGYILVAGTKSFVKLFTKPSITQPVAKIACNQDYAELVSISNVAVRSYVLGLGQTSAWGLNIWIGGICVQDSFHWAMPDGEFSFALFAISGLVHYIKVPSPICQSNFIWQKWKSFKLKLGFFGMPNLTDLCIPIPTFYAARPTSFDHDAGADVWINNAFTSLTLARYRE